MTWKNNLYTSVLLLAYLLTLNFSSLAGNPGRDPDDCTIVSIAQTSISVSSDGGTKTVSMTIRCPKGANSFPIQMQSKPSWVSNVSIPVPCSGTTDVTCNKSTVITYTTNGSQSSRSGSITFVGGTISITQSGCTPSERPGTITGSSTVCSGATETYSVLPITIGGGRGAASAVFEWVVPTGSLIMSGQGTNEVSVLFGTSSGTVKVRTTNSCQNSTYRTKTITVRNVPEVPGTITGYSSPCMNSSCTYSIPALPSGLDYEWIVPSGASLAPGSNSNTVTVHFGITSGGIKVMAKDQVCPALVSSYSSQSVDLVDPDGLINGSVSNAEKCEGESASFQINVNGIGYTYQWQKKAPGNTDFVNCTAQSAQTATFITNSNIDGMQYQCIVTKGNCSTASNAVTLTVYPAVSLIVDPVDVYISPNENVEITASGADSYNWSPATGLSSTTDATVIAEPTQTTEYTLIGTSNIICSDTKIVTVNQIELMGGKIELSGTELTVTPSGGEPPYEYSWSGGGGATEKTPVSASGIYTVTITDYREKEVSLNYNYTGTIAISNSTEDILKKNYIRTKVYNEVGTLIGSSASYANSLGKAIQSQSKNFTDDKTMVSQTIYDAMGRPTVTTLVAPVENTEFAYKTGFITNTSGDDYSYLDFDGIDGEKLNTPNAVNNLMPNTLGRYYSDQNYEEPFVPATIYPYSRVEYSKSNPGQTRKSSMPGEAYVMGSEHVVQSYSMPASNDELYDEFYTNIPDIEYRGLIKSISVDSEGKEAISYTSSEGHSIASCLTEGTIERDVTISLTDKEIDGIILPSYIDIHIPKGCSPGFSTTGTINEIIDLSTDANASVSQPGFYRIVGEGNISVTHNINYYNYAINVYDEAGRLKKSYSPKSIEEKLYDKMVATFKYNSLGWLLESEDLDAGISHFVYRKDGSIRFSQNEQQAIDNKFSYTNYDDAGRIVEVGEYKECPECLECTDCIVFETYDENAASGNTLSIHEIRENIYSETDPLQDGLDDTYCEYQSFTSYDLPDEDSDLSGYEQNFLLGKVSKTWNKNSTTWYSYLYDGKVDWVVQEIDISDDDNLFVTIDYTYDASGNVDIVMYQKDTYSARFDHVYTYDADNRLKEVVTIEYKDEPIKEIKSTKLQAKYFYYQHGPLKRVELANGLQGIDYVYNINGWLKSINHPDLTVGSDPGKDGHAYSAVPEDIFGMSLDYYNGDYSRIGVDMASSGDSYNGNIHAQRWQTRTAEPALPCGSSQWATQYSYDKKNWLTEALFGTIHAGGGSFIEYADKAYKVSDLTYDANGNLLSLNRNAIARTEGETTSTLAMDQFEYKYYGTKNQMKQLVDLNNEPSDLDDIKSGQEEFNYEYDSIGQMVANHQEGHYFEYDVYGKVTAVYEDEAHDLLPIVKYYYNEAGFRIKKRDVKNSKDTYYVRDASGSIMSIYERDGIGAILQTELPVYAASRIGMAYKNETGIDKFTYELTDHLGTVRATFTEGTTSEPEVLSYADYYPFGMVMPGRNHVSNKYRYGYQGQFAEKDEETGYNQFELRLYDARVGRWLTTDPMNQYWSPYMAMGNNPMRIYDPTGGEGETTIESSNVFVDFPNEGGYSTLDEDGNIWSVDLNGTIRNMSWENSSNVGANTFDSWMAKNASQPLVDLNSSFSEGFGVKGGVKVIGLQLMGGLHLATIEHTYNVATGYSKKQYAGLELGLGVVGISALYVAGKGFQFDYSISALKNLNSNPTFNIFSIEGQVGAGIKIELNVNPAKYIQNFDSTIDRTYLLYK